MSKNILLVALILLCSFQSTDQLSQDNKKVSEAVDKAVRLILDKQGDDGAWKGAQDEKQHKTYNDRYSIAITSLCCMALMAYPEIEKEKSAKALMSGLKYVLKSTKDPKNFKGSWNKVTTAWHNIWNMIYAIPMLVNVKRCIKEKENKAEIDENIQKMLAIIEQVQMKSGGWDYTACGGTTFVTAAVLHTLYLAKEARYQVDEDAIAKALKAVSSSKKDNNAYPYGFWKGDFAIESSIGRLSACELALYLHESKDVTEEAFAKSIDLFFKHREELEKNRNEPLHHGKFGIGGFYYHYAYYYTALALEHLSKETQKKYLPEITKAILNTQEKEGNFGTHSFTLGKTGATAFGLLILAQCGNK